MTNISKKVTNAFRSYIDKDYEEALFQICPAIDATANLEGYTDKENSLKYKSFLTNNIQIIVYSMTGTPLSGMAYSGAKFAEIKKPKIADQISLEEIIYHLIRSNLAHDVTVSKKIEITENTFGNGGDRILIPKTIIEGLILAVILSPSNLKETTFMGFNIQYKIHKSKIYLNSLWGKRDEFLKI